MVRSIEGFVEVVGRIVSLGIFLLIGVVMYEVLARYFFNLPTRWTYDMSGWLQVAYVFLGGAYALQKGYFVRVDVFYAHASSRTQAWIDLTFSTVLFGLFAGVLAWRGFVLAMASYAMNEIIFDRHVERPGLAGQVHGSGRRASAHPGLVRARSAQRVVPARSRRAGVSAVGIT